MRITLFSFIMSILWGSILAVLLHFCRKKPLFLRKFGIRNVLFLYMCCIVRMVFPYEFPFARALPSEGFFQGIRANVGGLGAETGRPWFFLAFAVVWFGTSAMLLLRFLVCYAKSIREFSGYRICEEERIQRTFQKILNECGDQAKLTIRRSRHVSIPMGVGILKKSILLPEDNYSDSELYYILLHEYTHFRNHDLLIKIAVHILSCMLWWNPVVYLLKKDIAQLLEIKCDLSVTGGMEDSRKADYLTAIVSVLKRAGKRNRAEEFYGTAALVARSYGSETVERFQAVSIHSGGRNQNGFVLAAGFLALAMLFYLSYSFTLHPGYQSQRGIRATETAPDAYDASEEISFVDIMRNTKSGYMYLYGEP
ncbi:M56 family metallopeptidase [Lachnospiraceae bacterium 29-84]